MKCPNCGAVIDKGRFCSYCGSKLSEDEYLTDIINDIFCGFDENGHAIFDTDYIVNSLKKNVEVICKGAKSCGESMKIDADFDEIAREELCYFIVYLLMADEGKFDEESLEVIEASASYRINRSKWEQCLYKGRVDSEEHYLSQPPRIIRLFLEADNYLYRGGVTHEYAAEILDMIKKLGTVFVVYNESKELRRRGRLNRFVRMAEKYIIKNAQNPDYKMVQDEEE